jgi:SRSO17 transposase
MGEAVEAFLGAAAQRFRIYAERLAQSFGHVNRYELLRGYLIGLVLPSRRKNVEPMAALLSMLPAAREAAKRQGIQLAGLRKFSSKHAKLRRQFHDERKSVREIPRTFNLHIANLYQLSVTPA